MRELGTRWTGAICALGGLALAGLALLAGVSAVPESGEPVRVLLVGDSITRGIVSGPGGASYAESLAERLGDGFRVTNVGRNGSTAWDWVGRGLFERFAIPALPAEIASILLGTNDAYGGRAAQPTSAERYAAAIRQLVARLREHGVRRVILLTPPRFPGRLRGVDQRLLAYRRALLEICSGAPAVVCGPDLHQLLDLGADFAAGDAHPNAQGHAKIAGALSDAIASALAQAD